MVSEPSRDKATTCRHVWNYLDYRQPNGGRANGPQRGDIMKLRDIEQIENEVNLAKAYVDTAKSKSGDERANAIEGAQRVLAKIEEFIDGLEV